MKKISIVVPVYNVENYIEECINSIINQTYKNLEIILVDDGSTDSSGKICDKFAKNDDRIKVIHKKNEGLGKTRNVGILESTGDYLFFVDSDDFIDLNTIEKLYNRSNNGTMDLVICDYYKYYNKENLTHIPIISFYDLDRNNSLITSMPTASCKLIKKEIFDANFLENKVFEDNAVMPYIVSNAKNWDYIKEPMYYYRQREGSLLNQPKYNPKWEDIFYALDNLSSLFNNKKTYEKYYNEIEYIYIEYLLHAANLKFIGFEEGISNIKKVSEVMKEKFPNWKKNKYYKKHNIKYKIVCNLFFYNQIKILKLILKG